MVGHKEKSLVFKRRSKGIKKKTMELGILCGVPVCTIIVGPNGEVDTWPENHNEVKAILKMRKDKCGRDGCHAAAKNDLELSNDNNLMKIINKDIAVGSNGSSVDSWIDVMNNLNSKIAAIDCRIELLQKKAVMHEQNCSEGIGFQDLHAETLYNMKMDNHGMIQSLQNLGPNNYTMMVSDVAPVQVLGPVTTPFSLGCLGTNAASSSGTSYYPYEQAATCADCMSFGSPSDNFEFDFMDNIEWDHDLQLGLSDGVENSLLELYLQQEAMLTSNSSVSIWFAN